MKIQSDTVNGIYFVNEFDKNVEIYEKIEDFISDLGRPLDHVIGIEVNHDDCKAIRKAGYNFDSPSGRKIDFDYDPDDDITLQELTGHESGIVVYGNEYIICNWTSYGEDELPKLFAGMLVGWEANFRIANSNILINEIPADFLDKKTCIYDLNDDEEDAKIAVHAGDFFAYEFPDGTIVISPKSWC